MNARQRRKRRRAVLSWLQPICDFPIVTKEEEAAILKLAGVKS